MQTSIVLAHGAFGDSSSWNDVTDRLVADGQHVSTDANTLRSIAGDTTGPTGVVQTLNGPVVLVGHPRRDLRALVA